jgi:hypothetical protein
LVASARTLYETQLLHLTAQLELEGQVRRLPTLHLSDDVERGELSSNVVYAVDFLVTWV